MKVIVFSPSLFPLIFILFHSSFPFLFIISFLPPTSFSHLSSFCFVIFCAPPPRAPRRHTSSLLLPSISLLHLLFSSLVLLYSLLSSLPFNPVILTPYLWLLPTSSLSFSVFIPASSFFLLLLYHPPILLTALHSPLHLFSVLLPPSHNYHFHPPSPIPIISFLLSSSPPFRISAITQLVVFSHSMYCPLASPQSFYWLALWVFYVHLSLYVSALSSCCHMLK